MKTERANQLSTAYLPLQQVVRCCVAFVDKEAKVLVLAGGLGTRLRSLLRNRPKPMAQIKGKPLLEYQIHQLRSQGFKSLVLCVGHLACHIQDYFGDGCDWGVQSTYAVETELLDTAGAIKNAQEFIGDTFLALHGDSYLEIDFREQVGFHTRRQSSDCRTIGTIAIVAVDDAASYGRIELNAETRLLGFAEEAETRPGWINGGVYVLEPAILDLIPAGREVSAKRETFPLTLMQNHHLFGYPVLGFFVDIGTPEGYHRFCRYVEEAR
jgi:D-glycero-alpha-D-manno-heptose 1-phosphate guanylyltransferase